jgi:hypothetical protein
LVGESGLLKKARAIDAVTFVAVILVSPASVVFSYLFGVTPDSWVRGWVTYVFFFILVALGISVLGFSFSTDFRLKADGLARNPAPQQKSEN